MSVRIASAADVPALAKLRRASAEEDGTALADADFEGRFGEWFASERDRTTWLAEHEGTPIGFVGMYEYRRMPKPGKPGGLWGYLGNMFVLADHRNRGVGAELLRAVLARADERAYVRVVLSPSARSVPFYQRAGFADADGSNGDRLLVRRGAKP